VKVMSFGSCGVCNQGNVIGCVDKRTGQVFVECDECYSIWDRPASIYGNGTVGAGVDRDSWFAREIDIKATEWEERAFDWIDGLRFMLYAHECMIANNILNEVVNGLRIDDVESRVAPLHDVKLLLEQIHSATESVFLTSEEAFLLAKAIPIVLAELEEWETQARIGREKSAVVKLQARLELYRGAWKET